MLQRSCRDNELRARQWVLSRLRTDLTEEAHKRFLIFPFA